MASMMLLFAALMLGICARIHATIDALKIDRSFVRDIPADVAVPKSANPIPE